MLRIMCIVYLPISKKLYYAQYTYNFLLKKKKKKIKSTSDDNAAEARKSRESTVSMQMGIFLNGALVFIAFNVRESR